MNMLSLFHISFKMIYLVRFSLLVDIGAEAIEASLAECRHFQGGPSVLRLKIKEGSPCRVVNRRPSV